MNRFYRKKGFYPYERLPDGTERRVPGISLSNPALQKLWTIISQTPAAPPAPPLFTKSDLPKVPNSLTRPTIGQNVLDVLFGPLAVSAAPAPPTEPKPRPIEIVPPNPPSIPADLEIAAQIIHPSVVLLMGKRNSGKSATAFRIAEHKRSTLRPHIVGPSSLGRLLPEGFGLIESLEDAPRNCLVIIDEASLVYGARDSMREANKRLAEAINLSRQRGQTLLFLAQEARMLDVTIVSQADVIIIKELGEISQEFERKELRRYTDPARLAFRQIVGDRRKWAWLFNDKTGFKGLLPVELPTFWSNRLSTGLAAGVRDAMNKDASAVVRPGKKWTKQETEANVLLLSGGMSVRGISRVTGVPKSTVQDIINKNGGMSWRKGMSDP